MSGVSEKSGYKLPYQTHTIVQTVSIKGRRNTQIRTRCRIPACLGQRLVDDVNRMPIELQIASSHIAHRIADVCPLGVFAIWAEWDESHKIEKE